MWEMGTEIEAQSRGTCRFASGPRFTALIPCNMFVGPTLTLCLLFRSYPRTTTKRVPVSFILPLIEHS